MLEEAEVRLALAKVNTRKDQATQKRNSDRCHQREVLRAGDFVFASACVLRSHGVGERKLGSRSVVTFTILQRVTNLAYVVDTRQCGCDEQ